MSDWSDRLFSSTRGRVIKLLSRDPSTVSDMAAELGLTDNAIRASLAGLERDGLVRQVGKRASTRKPETLFGLTDSAEQLFPRAYHVLFNTLVGVLQRRLPPAETQKLLREVGTALAAAQPVRPGARSSAQASTTTSSAAALQRRIAGAMEVLRELGGLPELEKASGQLMIRGHRCPLEPLVREHPDVCILAEAMLTDLIGVPVHQACDHGHRPRCRFMLPQVPPS